MHFEEEE